MNSNAQRLSFQKNVNRNAIKRASEAIQATGRALPCRVVAVNGAVVTVAFEMNTAPWNIPNITIPKAESNWIREPTQVGDLGWTVPADVYLGGVSGLGGGVADFKPVSNLSALVFQPISHSDSPPSDQNAVINQAPNGFIAKTTTGTASSITLDVTGTIIKYGAVTITINASGVTIDAPVTTINGNLVVNGSIVGDGGLAISGGSGATITGSINATGDIKAGSISLETHVHSGVQSGTDDTGAPV